MCRLSAIVSDSYFSPFENILALETMKEGHDGSGLGLVLRDLGGEFENLKEYPILSCITSNEGYDKLKEFMNQKGFEIKYRWEAPKHIESWMEIEPREHYLVKAYEYPDYIRDKSKEEKEQFLLQTRLEIRSLGLQDESITVFSFWPDTIVLKEVGDPLEVGLFFGLDKDSSLKAKVIFAQGRQNTNYAINLYACHPFFIQGFFTMTNGENTAFVPIREFLMSRRFPGYIGYNSDSEVFAHILHYSRTILNYPLKYYKDIITPMLDHEIDSCNRKDIEVIKLMRRSLRMLTIDGPNCVIGCDKDNTVFMVQDAKKLRPGVVGGIKGKIGFMSEICGLSSAIPNRDMSKDVFPMKYDLVYVKPGAKEINVWNQKLGQTTTITYQ
jgi:glutamate synthase domain-containing protein 1